MKHWESSRFTFCSHATYATLMVFLITALIHPTVGEAMAVAVFAALGALWTSVMGIPKAVEHWRKKDA